jgi:transposase
VAHAILKAAYSILKNNTPYKELGPDFFEQRRKAEIVKKSVKRIETLGFSVIIEQALTPVPLSH